MAEPVDLSRLLPDARAFLEALSQNNTRAWFNAHKARYDSQLKRPGERLLADMAPWIEAETGEAPRTKLFRPHRDVRFSEDKTPYHTHLHLLWSLPDGRGWFFGLAPDYATAGMGIMSFDRRQVEAWRAAVDGAPGEALAEMLDASDWRVDPPALKRVPPPYPADHPREHLLRYKGFVAWQDDLDAALQEDPRRALERAFDRLSPLARWLAQMI
ncbi:TIGR02453 family protein [Pseudoponticoccus marisrubri]|uniref:TIGR02453 family protein n=1 Tax=Pseudoponticoccus marisrubri TaxID=1685382 RepID=A0A0W7WL55_9RHOB|nr:TIGR02453 family protein [Pseudoponticoccus marisrubri]KUF11265.1 hypothetical protein AVJ23_09480 [Pseudoponticoccus marisrubri]